MEEDQTVNIKPDIQKVRERYDNEVVPKQKEALENLVTKPIKDILGAELNDKIKAAFNEPAHYSSEIIRAMAQKLDRVDAFGPSNELREVDGFLVRRRSLGDTLVSTEVFDNNQSLPYELRRLAVINKLDLAEFHPYKHMVITDGASGLSVDLLLSNKSDSNILISTPVPITTFSPVGNFSLIADSDEFHLDYEFSTGLVVAGMKVRLKKEIAYLHEAGHSYQFLQMDVDSSYARRRKESDKLTAQELAEYVVEERNASAFALSAVRRYKELGVDLTQITDIQEIEAALRSYDSGLDQSEAVFSKSKPKPKQSPYRHLLRGIAMRGHIDKFAGQNRGRIR